MNLSDITKINFGAANISAVYNGGIKLWPKQVDTGNKVMKFTTTDGNTWSNTKISAYTADNRLIEPVLKDATGWTYPEDVTYLSSKNSSSNNLLTFEGFAQAVKIKLGEYLFYSNRECTDISTDNIDTSECTSMKSMFEDCGNLASLDLSNWDTSKVTNMSNMFNFCGGLATLNLSGWDISKVTDMSHMFENCVDLATLDLSGWNMVSFINTTDMFYNCLALQTVKMTNCNQAAKYKIRAALNDAGLTNTVITE